VTVIVAPLTAAPCESVTVPCSRAVSLCARDKHGIHSISDRTPNHKNSFLLFMLGLISSICFHQMTSRGVRPPPRMSTIRPARASRQNTRVPRSQSSEFPLIRSRSSSQTRFYLICVAYIWRRRGRTTGRDELRTSRRPAHLILKHKTRYNQGAEREGINHHD
jgi:hypothetical protein